MSQPYDIATIAERRRAAHAERVRLAQARWAQFQTTGRRARLPSPHPTVRRLLARGKSPGRRLLLATSGVWDEAIDRSLGGVPGPTASLGGYVQAGPDPAVQPRALFDQHWYLDRAPGLRGSRWPLLAHYLVVGDSHNLSPHPLLDAPAYRARHGASMAAHRLSALEHFLFAGAADGADPHPLFDVKFYVGQSDDVARTGENPLVHYLREGWRSGLDPHPLFAGDWYLEHNPDAAAAGIAPLLHYVTQGAADGRDPHPLFETAHYQKQAQGAGRGHDALTDFLVTGARKLLSPSPRFQPKAYLELTADPAARANPLLHYLTVGAFEGIWSSADFDEAAYFSTHPEAADSPVTALDHWVRHRTERPEAGGAAGHAISAQSLFQDLRAATAPDPAAYGLAAYDALKPPRATADLSGVRVVAIRRAAPIDWVAVVSALPNFRGHIQPRLPVGGFPDPGAAEALRQDVALAERYGIAGFCHVLTDPRHAAAILEVPHPFCLAWAGPADAPEATLAGLAPPLDAPQAIRIDGRPVLVLTAGADAAAWRKASGARALHLVQDGGAAGSDPRDRGFDARLPAPAVGRGAEGPTGPVINPDFRGQIHDYAAIVREAQARPTPAWPEHPRVVSGRDTTPRSPEAGVIWQGACPGAFQAWLESESARVAAGAGLVFAEAWNDWLGGAVMAPDRRFGHGWLEAVSNAADRELLEA